MSNLQALLLLITVTSTYATNCLECMESHVIIDDFNSTDPAAPSTCSAAHNTTSCPKGCFTMRVSHGGFHYGVAIKNHLIHRGCRHGAESTMCDQLNSHLDPLTLGDVSCRIDVCETELCNRGGGESRESEENIGNEEVGVEVSGGKENEREQENTAINGKTQVEKNAEKEKIKEKGNKKNGKKNKRDKKSKRAGKNKKQNKKRKAKRARRTENEKSLKN